MVPISHVCVYVLYHAADTSVCSGAIKFPLGEAGSCIIPLRPDKPKIHT
jgi:hypothetical protein